jgi:hypothetical protein
MNLELEWQLCRVYNSRWHWVPNRDNTAPRRQIQGAKDSQRDKLERIGGKWFLRKSKKWKEVVYFDDRLERAIEEWAEFQKEKNRDNKGLTFPDHFIRKCVGVKKDDLEWLAKKLCRPQPTQLPGKPPVYL